MVLQRVLKFSRTISEGSREVPQRTFKKGSWKLKNHLKNLLRFYRDQKWF
jgi:hypothetical protein